MSAGGKYRGLNYATFSWCQVAITRLILIGIFRIRQDNSKGLDFTEESAFVDAEFPGRLDTIPLIPPQGVGQKDGLHIFEGQQIWVSGSIGSGNAA